MEDCALTESPEPAWAFHFFEEIEKVTIVAHLREQAPRVLGRRGANRQECIDARESRDERPEERTDHFDRPLIEVDGALAADPVVKSVVGLLQSIQIGIKEIGVTS